MKRDFPFIKIQGLIATTFAGKPDPGTRMYRAYGSEAGYRVWFDTISKICEPDGLISTAGAAQYVMVSRAGLHKRLKEGRLTVFFYHKMKGSEVASDCLREDYYLRYPTFPSNAFIPVSECKAWAAELEGRTLEEFERRSMVNIIDWDEKSTISPPSPRKWQRKVKKD